MKTIYYYPTESGFGTDDELLEPEKSVFGLMIDFLFLLNLQFLVPIKEYPITNVPLGHTKQKELL